MSHYLDIDDVHVKCFILEHITNGSDKYCSDRDIASENDLGEGNFDEYWGWTKAIVSTYLLECAIKIRVIQDSVRGKEDIINLDSLDNLACKYLVLGNISQGTFNLNLRESCNKIIHAKKAVLKWEESKKGDLIYKYWNGKFELSGDHYDKSWTLILNVNQWAKAMSSFVKLFEDSDASIHLGQDWY